MKGAGQRTKMPLWTFRESVYSSFLQLEIFKANGPRDSHAMIPGGHLKSGLTTQVEIAWSNNKTTTKYLLKLICTKEIVK